MTRKMISWLACMAVFLFILQSCVHDEIYSASDPDATEYHSKSLWKEDEKYIKNVMAIYRENEGKIKKVNSSPFWDYAMTMDRFDESFLMVPVVENGKVTAVLYVPRKDQRIYFTYTQLPSDLDFFQSLISNRIKKAMPTEKSNAMAKLVCTTKTISMFYPDDESNPNGSGHWESKRVTECKNQQMDQCMGEVLPDGTCLGGSGSDPGYPYPGGGGENPDPQEDPCEKIKTNFKDVKFKEKLAAIDKPEILNYDHEMGYAAGYPPANTGITNTQYPPMENTIGSHSVSLPDGNQYFGFMHTHNNESNGGIPVKIFSPADLATFLTSCVANADAHGSIGDAFAIVVTSGGNYMLQYSGNSSGFGIGSNTIKFWKLWYEREIKAIQDEDGTINQNKVENLFLRFLKEKVKIDGIELYQIAKTTGQAQKLNLNNDNTVVSIPCP